MTPIHHFLREDIPWSVEQSADCAEHVLPIFERAFPGDARARRALAAAWAFAEGKISVQALDDARAAAWAATRAADAAGHNNGEV